MSTMTKTIMSSSESQCKKKDAPFGTPIPQQDYGTTERQKTQAELLFDRIGTGAAYALRRPKDAKVDRQLRRLIAEANMSGEDCIINAGYGYYRPGEDDDVEAEIYFAAERSRAREILRKVSRMEQVYDRRYQTNE